MSVKINYSTVGFVNWGQDFKTLYNDLLNWRKEHSLKKNFDKNKKLIETADQLFISIYYNIENNELSILTDGERIMTPIFKQRPDKDIYDMIQSGDMIYVCPAMI